MNSEYEVSIDSITGFMFGIEFPDAHEIDEDLRFCMVFDFGIVRFVLLRWETK